MKNIVIIGMPGVGKTTVARAVSEIAGRPALDIDEMIERAHGPIPGIFERGGEGYFRSIEKETVRIASRQAGVVIATGGGSVLDPENVERLKETGTLYWIRRPLRELATGGRPLSAGGMDALEKLWRERKDIYKEAADRELQNTTIEETARAIVRLHEAGEKSGK